MKKADVKIGGVYRAKVSDKLTDVRIDQVNPQGGWDATNLATKKRIRIKSAQRLRAPSTTKSSAGKAAAPAGPKTKPSPKTSTKPASKPAKAKGEKPVKQRQPSGLDLAAKVLAESKQPLNAQAIAERAIAAGWKTNGKTPHATLYAAIIREIRDKGSDARFEKVERGQFRATAAAKKAGA